MNDGDHFLRPDETLSDDGSRPWRWLESTHELQTQTYGYDFESMSTGDLASYVTWNVFATYQELAEISVEHSWKPWAVDDPFVNRRRILDEVVDCLHFLGNILVGLRVDDAELESAYRAKQGQNRRRSASGTYSARKGGVGDGSDL